MGRVSMRSGAIAVDLSARGMAGEVARAVSADLDARHPLARRLGIRRLARELRELGLPEDDALDAAAMLHALEALELEASYDHALRELREAGLPEPCVLRAALEAAHLHRECRASDPEGPDGVIPAMAMTLILATAVVVGSAVAAHLLSL